MTSLPSLTASRQRVLLSIQPLQVLYSRNMSKQTNGWKDTRLGNDLRMCTYRYANRDEREMGGKRGGTDRETKRERARESESRWKHATRHRETKQVSWLRPHTHLHKNSCVCCEAKQPFAGRLLSCLSHGSSSSGQMWITSVLTCGFGCCFLSDDTS